MKTKLFSLQDQNSLEEKKIAFHHNNHCAVRNLDILRFFKSNSPKTKNFMCSFGSHLIQQYYCLLLHANPGWVSLTSG